MNVQAFGGTLFTLYVFTISILFPASSDVDVITEWTTMAILER